LPKGFNIYQNDSIWYLVYSEKWGWRRDKSAISFLFTDGMKILSDGMIVGTDRMDIEKLKKLNKEILKYSRNYITALFAGEVEKPGPGDCWNCALVVSNANGSMHAPDHLKKHLKEKYYVPSLLVRAIEVFPVSKVAGWILSELWHIQPEGQSNVMMGFGKNVAKQQLRSSLRRYLRRQLGLAS